MKKVIINLCPTGMVGTKKDNTNIPITPDEIIKDAIECAKQGASIIHLHARDKDGQPTWKKEVFAEIISGIRDYDKNLVLVATTSGRNWIDFERRSEVLELAGDLKPDMASLTMGSMNFIKTASMNSPEMIEKLAIKMREKNIKPELEVFEPGMLHKTNYLIEKGIIPNESPYINILLGSLGTSPLHPVSIGSFLALMPANAVWAMAGVGSYQLDSNVAALSLGGNVRLGLEDNSYFDRRKNILASNKQLVKRIADIIKLMGLEIATPSEARSMLAIHQ